MIAIRAAEESDRAAVSDTLTLAFAADPIVRFWMPGATQYLHGWPRLAHSLGERGYARGTVMIASDFAAVAMWLPPGVEADPAQMAALNLPRPAPDVEEISRAFRAEMARHHPAEPHWYLWTLGVDPKCQGRGLGSALLKHGLARADDDGVLAYLEATSPKSAALYARHGFETLAVIRMGDMPPMIPMLRRPRSAAAAAT